MPVCEVRNLTVKYGSFTALQDFSVDVPEGCIGLLGPNGAGKTTFLKTILGFIQPSSGTAKVAGKDVVAESKYIRQLVGLMPEQDCHIPGMTAVMFVAFAGELAGMPQEQALRRAHEVLEYCGLGEARYRNVETYSTGMKQRIKLAQALVHGPKLLLLDEPTNGLDPAGREHMLELVRSVSHGKGVNVIVSSHLLPDIERVCDHVIVVAGGKLRASGLLKDMKKLEGHPVDVELKEPNGAFVEQVLRRGAKLISAGSTQASLPMAPPTLGGAAEIEIPKNAYRFRFQAPGMPEDVCKLMLGAANDAGAQVRGFMLAERSLQDAFLEVLSG